VPVSKREATAIFNSLSAGVVPRTGLRHIAVGRLREVAAIKNDLDHIREGGAAVRFIIGRYGSGKSFMLQLIRTYALESKFVVADADFTPERWLQGSGGRGVATYRELMKNLSTQTRPDGNALSAIIERWISNLQAEVSGEGKAAQGTPEFAEAVKARIMSSVNSMEELVHGYDFGRVISLYYDAYVTGNEELKTNAIRWLRGEFGTKTEAREALGVRSIIEDDNFYDYLKVIAKFATRIGYAGLLVCLDEAVNLYKITQSVSRNSNYEKILSIVNDSLQGRAGHFGFIFGGTPEFLEDTRRGLFSYEALRSRLSGSRFVTDDMRDYSSPVLSLPPLTPEEIFVLLKKVRDLHRESVPGSRGLEDDAIVAYMEESLRRAGATEFATPRDLVREFVNLQNLLSQYPERSWREILTGVPPVETAAQEPGTGLERPDSTQQDEDPLSRFSDFRIG